MKILWLTGYPFSSIKSEEKHRVIRGWEISLEEALKQYSKIDLEIAYISSINEPSFIHEGVKYHPIYIKKSKNPFIRILKRVENTRRRDNKLINTLLKIITTSQPELIHVHGTEEFFGLIQSYCKIPIVISLQGILSAISEKYFSGIPQNIAIKKDSLYNRLRLVSWYWHYKYLKNRAIVERHILKEAKWIIGRTDWDKRVTHILAPDSKYFISNEVLRTDFYNKKWEKTKFNRPIKLLTTTGNSLYKGFETILKIAYILSENKILDFEWNIIGVAATDPIIKITQKYLKIDYHAVNVKPLGVKNSTELADLLMQSDIYCQVSHIENSPNSLCEAMIIGMPVIASFVGGTASLLTDKKEGVLVQEGEPYAYAGAIAELSTNFDLAFSYAQNARIRAQERHNKETIVTKLIDIYNSILNQ